MIKLYINTFFYDIYMFNTINFYVILSILAFLYFYINKYYKDEFCKFLEICGDFFDEIHSTMDLIYEDAAETDHVD